MDGDWTGRARAQMRARGVSQQDLSRLLDCTRGAVGHYLSGRRHPSLEQMETIAKVLGVDLLWLLRGDPPGGVADSPGADSYSGLHIPIMGSTGTGFARGPAKKQGMRLGSRACYGLKITGSDYSPRLYAGEVAVFDPATDAGPGDEVLVRFRDGKMGLYALVNRGRARITLQSLAGDRIRRQAELKEVKAVHKLIAVFRPDDE